MPGRKASQAKSVGNRDNVVYGNHGDYTYRVSQHHSIRDTVTFVASP